MPDATYSTKTYRKIGGDEIVIASGGALNIETGGAITANGTQASAIVNLTDGTGGTANDALVAVPSDTLANAAAAANDNFADLSAKLNLILAALRGAGIIAP